MTDGSSVEPESLVGVVLAEAIELVAKVGIGTMGTVYRGLLRDLDRFVAVKVLHPFLMQTPSARERFFREARLMARLKHPGIVRLIGSGELPRAGGLNGEAYLIYEYLEGETLRAQLSRVGRLSTNDAVSTLVEIAEAVAQAHEENIIHRDLKPENVMLAARDNEPKRFVVLDFGLARALDGQGESLTREGAILGTPQYLSPEAARGEPATTASDVYALATMLYELIAGRAPFAEGSAVSILVNQANTSVPMFEPSLAVAPPLERFVLRNLEKTAGARCRNAQDFADGLREFSCRS